MIFKPPTKPSHNTIILANIRISTLLIITFLKTTTFAITLSITSSKHKQEHACSVSQILTFRNKNWARKSYCIMIKVSEQIGLTDTRLSSVSHLMTKPTKYCAASEDSDQPGHPPSLIRVFTVRMKKASILSYLLGAEQRLWSDWADAQADLSLR